MDVDVLDAPSDILEEATDLESNFYSQGYKDGYDHGRLHGLFEGREIGKEKGFELWEEVGYYEGWAGFHLSRIGVEPKGKEARVTNHAKILLDLISSFPTDNPTPSQVGAGKAPGETAEIDLAALLSNIRARYKLLCASLGARPRLAVAASATAKEGESSGGGVVEGIEGPMKGVDTAKLKF